MEPLQRPDAKKPLRNVGFSRVSFGSEATDSKLRPSGYEPEKARSADLGEYQKTLVAIGFSPLNNSHHFPSHPTLSRDGRAMEVPVSAGGQAGLEVTCRQICSHDGGGAVP